MSTGVNEYLLSQSLGNPTNKMPLLIDKIYHNTRRETTGILLSNTEGFFTLWCLSCISLFLSLVALWSKWVHSLLGGFVAGDGNETVHLLLNLPSSLLALLLSHFISVAFFPLPSLSLLFSSPPRFEQVIGITIQKIIQLWWERAFFYFFLNTKLEFPFWDTVLISHFSKLLSSDVYTAAWGLDSARLLSQSMHDLSVLRLSVSLLIFFSLNQLGSCTTE